MNKQPRYHELIRPLREIVRGVGEFVVDRVVPSAVVENLFAPPEARGAEAMLEEKLGYDDMGNWHNPEPFGWDVVAPQPDKAKLGE